MGKKIAYAGVFTAVITILTMGSIPIPGGGYIHVGDSIIFLCCFIMPLPFAAIASGAGSFFADLLLPYGAAYAPWTLIIKALMAVIVRLFIFRNDKTLNCVIAFTIASLFMQAGYLLVNVLYFGESAGVVIVLINLIQTIASVPIAVLLIKAVKRIPDLESVRAEWRRK